MVFLPDNPEQCEADREGRRTFQCDQQIIESARRFEGHDEQRERKRKHGIAESLQSQHLTLGPVCIAAHWGVMLAQWGLWLSALGFRQDRNHSALDIIVG